MVRTLRCQVVNLVYLAKHIKVLNRPHIVLQINRLRSRHEASVRLVFDIVKLFHDLNSFSIRFLNTYILILDRYLLIIVLFVLFLQLKLLSFVD